MTHGGRSYSATTPPARARATIAGLSSTERATLAAQTARAEADGGLSLDLHRLKVDAADKGDFTSVTLSYDASNQSLFKLGFVPMPSALIVRSAVVRKGGL